MCVLVGRGLPDHSGDREVRWKETDLMKGDLNSKTCFQFILNVTLCKKHLSGCRVFLVFIIIILTNLYFSCFSQCSLFFLGKKEVKFCG